MKGLAPLEGAAVPPLHRAIPGLFASDVEFKRWEDSLWLGLFFAGQLNGVLAARKRIDADSPAGRIQSFLEVAQGKGAFFSPQSLLQDLPLAMRRTCCVRVDDEPFGTGFLIAPDAILTNWHVVRSLIDKDAEVERISAAFDYLHAAGVGEPPIVVKATKIVRWRPARQEFLPTAPADDRPLDYALVHLASSMPTDRGFFDVGAAPDLATGSRVVIVGHPEGHPLAVSFSRKDGLHNLENSLVYYDADTLHGSSGSLVLLENQGRLKAALLHAGGKSADENFGIYLRAISDDLKNIPAAAPSPPIKREASLEGYFRGDDERSRARKLAMLLSALPPDVKIDPQAPASAQIESLEAQWDERFAEALRIARSVALPSSERAIAPVPPPPPPVPDPRPPESDHRVLAFIIFAVIVGGVAVWVISNIMASRATSACGLSVSDFDAPSDDAFRCGRPYVKTAELTNCELTGKRSETITGQCANLRAVGVWTSKDSHGTTVWSANFDTGEWHVPVSYGGYNNIQAIEQRDGRKVLSRSFVLPGTNVHVYWANGKTTARCGQASYSFTNKTAAFTLDDGTHTLVFDNPNVTFAGREVRMERLEEDPGVLYKRFASAVEACQPVSLVAPKCKLGTWESDCLPQLNGIPCFQHSDPAKTIDFVHCGGGGLHERAGQSVPMSPEVKATHAGCSTFTPCVPNLIHAPVVDCYLSDSGKLKKGCPCKVDITTTSDAGRKDSVLAKPDAKTLGCGSKLCRCP